MKRLLLLTTLILVFSWASPVYAHWDDDVWVEHQRLEITDWNSKLELECFLALSEDTPVVLIADATGRIAFDGQCEDFAFAIRNKAETWGKRLEVEILTPQEYRQYYGKGLPPDYHAVNKAIIGNEWWYVDKQADKLWHPLNLD